MRMEEEIYSIFIVSMYFHNKKSQNKLKLRDLFLNSAIPGIDCHSSNYTGWNRANCNFLRSLVHTG